MPAIPLKGQHHENWQALLAVAEKTPDVRVWSRGAAMWFSLPRLLRIWLGVFVALSVMYLVNSTPPRDRTWGHCWDRALWDWYDAELKKSGATKREPDNRGYSPTPRRLYPIPIGPIDSETRSVQQTG
jgi:hypothetical protein